MNLRGGWALVRSSWASWLQYRTFFFVLAFGWMIPPLVSLFVWQAAAEEGALASFNRSEFAAYYLALVLANQLTYAQANWTLGDVIREGSLSPWLMRPGPALFHVLSSEVAGKVVTMIFVLPVAALLSVGLQPELHTGLVEILLALVALLLAWALRFTWGCTLALLAFWTSRANALLTLQEALVFLLSGSVAPVALLPGGLQRMAQALPFRYMVGFPVEVLVGKLTAGELAAGLAVQVAWLLAAMGLCRLAWVSGLRRYTAIGG